MKNILIIGLGNLGRHLAIQMIELGNEVMVIDKDEKIGEKYASLFPDLQIGDCTNETVMHTLGINNFDICFVTVGSDLESSLEITALLKDLHAKYIVSKAKNEKHASFLKRIGANDVIYPEKEVAEKLAVRYNKSNVFEYINLTSEYSIYEIAIPNDWIGESIGSLNVRKKYKVNILAVKNENNILPLPGAEHLFIEGDHIVVLGKSSEVFKISP